MLFVGPLVGAGGSFGLRRGWEVKLTGGGGGESSFRAEEGFEVFTSIDNFLPTDFVPANRKQEMYFYASLSE